MFGVQKERLRQLMASAILELWKKETGSLASVFIEATVCITSCNSRMTVIQLADHFPGLIPEPPPPQVCMEKTFLIGGNNDCSRVGGRVCQLAGQKRKMTEDYREKTGAVSDDKMLTDGCGRGGQHQQPQHLLMDSNNNPTVVADPERVSSDDEEEDEDSSEESEEVGSDAEELQRCPSADTSSGMVGLVMPGPVFYSHTKSMISPDKAKTSKSAANDSGIQDMSTETLVIDMSLKDEDCTNNRSLPLVDSKCPTSSALRWLQTSPGIAQKNGVANGIDLHQPDLDLLLSSPQNYTEQVRDVIRARLLNGKTKTTAQKTSDHNKPVMGVSEVPAGLSQWLDIMMRGEPGISKDGRIFQQQQQLPRLSPPPLQLVPMRKNFADAVDPVQPLHPSVVDPFLLKVRDLARPFEVPKVSMLSETKLEDYPGLSLPFSDPKIAKFDGSTDGNISGCEQKTYKCGFCHKTFLFKSKYHEHLPVHTSARPFECHMCTRTYKYKYDLRVHLRTHLGIPTKSTICPFCSGKFLTNKLLRNHIKEAHREQQQISEEQCAQSLDNAAALSPTRSSV